MLRWLLEQAAFNGNLREVRRLVEERRVDPNSRVTPPFFVNLRKRVTGGCTPLQAASYNGHFHVVQYLIEEAQANVQLGDITNKAVVDDGGGWTALHYACHYANDVRTVRCLVEVGGARIEKEDEDGNTPLHLAACAVGNTLETLRYLVEERQANLSAKNRQGWTPLSKALHAGRNNVADVVRCLLPRMESIDKSSLRVAWMHPFGWDIVEMLLEKYASECNLATAFRTNPIGTIFQFPLLSKGAFEDCIDHYASTILSSSDDHGHLLIHSALASTNWIIQSPSIVLLLFKHEPRLALTRDPTTGFYPHETAGSLASDAADDEECWLDVAYNLFRSNPEQLLVSRGLTDSASSIAAEDIIITGEPRRKRRKTSAHIQ